jgi:hypothetical protein
VSKRTQSRKQQSLLPSKPPKKSGKRGPRPLDPKEDFDQPTKKEAEGSLIAEQPPQPAVVGSRIKAHYLKPIFSKTTKGERLLAMHMTFPLTEEHTGDSLLPKSVCEGWGFISKHGRKRLDLVGIPGQKATFYLTPDIDDAKLVLPAAKVINVSLAVVQKKGEGEAQKVIRLSFRLQVPVSHEVAKFAELNYGNDFWIKLQETEEPLFDEDDED